MRITQCIVPVLLSAIIVAELFGATSVQAGSAVPFSVPSGGTDIVKEFGYTGYSGKWTVPGGGTANVKANGFYLQAGYEFLPDWQVYARLGAATFKEGAGISAGGESSGDSSKTIPFGGIGVKGRALLGRGFDLFTFAEAEYFGNYTSARDIMVSGTPFGLPEDVPAVESVSIEKQLGANAGLLISTGGERLAVYAGPVVFLRLAEMSRELEIGGDRYANEGRLREKGGIGGVVGVRLPLAKETDIVLEAQQKSDLSFNVAVAYLRLDF